MDEVDIHASLQISAAERRQAGSLSVRCDAACHVEALRDCSAGSARTWKSMLQIAQRLQRFRATKMRTGPASVRRGACFCTSPVKPLQGVAEGIGEVKFWVGNVDGKVSQVLPVFQVSGIDLHTSTLGLPPGNSTSPDSLVRRHRSPAKGASASNCLSESRPRGRQFRTPQFSGRNSCLQFLGVDRHDGDPQTIRQFHHFVLI